MIKKIINGCRNRFLDWCSKGTVRCFVPESSVVLGFTVVDDKSVIGEHTYINRHCEITSSTIGNYCSIGSGVRVGSGEHDFSLLSTSSFITNHDADDLTLKSCDIGNDVWVGTQAFIKRGVVIGDGAVIGAHSVVTKDIPCFAIVAGNPARILKYRFSEQVREKILVTKWWQSSLEDAKEILKDLNVRLIEKG